MPSPITIAIQHCVDQYQYPTVLPTETRYRYTAVVQGISEKAPTGTAEWDSRKADYVATNRVKGSNGLLYEATNSVPVGFDPVSDFAVDHWDIVRVPELPSTFELFLLQRTAAAEPVVPPFRELVTQSAYLGLPYPPTFQLIDPTRYSPTALKLWSQLLVSVCPPVDPGETPPWDPFKRQQAPAKTALEANNVERLYTSRALVRETTDLIAIDVIKENLLRDVELFTNWYNQGVQSNWTTMNDVTIPTGWAVSVFNR